MQTIEPSKELEEEKGKNNKWKRKHIYKKATNNEIKIKLASWINKHG